MLLLFVVVLPLGIWCELASPQTSTLLLFGFTFLARHCNDDVGGNIGESTHIPGAGICCIPLDSVCRVRRRQPRPYSDSFEKVAV